MKKTNRIRIVFGVLSLTISVVLIFIAFLVVNLNNEYRDSNTKEYEATIVWIEENNNKFLIEVEEFEGQLIANKETLINTNSADELEQGTYIIFRTLIPLETITQSESVAIVSLTANNQNVITLESFNKVQARNKVKIRIGCIIFSLLFLIVFIILIVLSLKKKKN